MVAGGVLPPKFEAYYCEETMKGYYQKLLTSVRLYFLKMRRRAKITDLHALSVQQISDYYFGNFLLGEIRQLQGLIGEDRIHARPATPAFPEKNDSHYAEEI